jgi:hypothetical protein
MQQQSSKPKISEVGLYKVGNKQVTIQQNKMAMTYLDSFFYSIISAHLTSFLMY